MADTARKLPRRVHRKVRIVAQNRHAKRLSGISNQNTDCAKTNYTERLARKLRPGKRTLPLFHSFADSIALSFQAFCPFNGRDHFSRGKQQPRQNELFHRVGIGAGGVEDDDSLLAAGIDGNIVHARACTRNCQQRFRQLHFMHGSRTNQNSVRCGNIFTVGIILAEAV